MQISAENYTPLPFVIDFDCDPIERSNDLVPFPHL